MWKEGLQLGGGSGDTDLGAGWGRPAEQRAGMLLQTSGTQNPSSAGNRAIDVGRRLTVGG